MANMSKLTIIGNIGADPISPINTRPDYICLNVAVQDSRKDRTTGDRFVQTDWYECGTSKPALFHLIKNNAKKGDSVYIDGKPKYNIYETKAGEKKVKIIIDINTLTFLGGSRRDEDQSYVFKASEVNGNIDFE